MTVRVTSPDDAAVFQIYPPPYRYTLDGGALAPRTPALPGAEEGHDISHWTGRLPASGNYLLVVGRTYGGGPYSLSVKIK